MKKSMEELVILAGSGNNKAKEELVRLTIDDAYVVARSLCHSEADAQDVLQDCYMQAFVKLDTLNNPSSFRAWLKTMVRNRCFDLYKSYRMQNERSFSDYGQENEEGDIIELDPIDVSSVYQPEVQMDMKTKREIVFSIMNTLPAEQREVVYLMYYENRKISEIAQQLQCTENTVKSRLRYAKAKIETEVLALEKKEGIKLYNVAPLLLFSSLCRSVQEDAIVSVGKYATKKLVRSMVVKNTLQHVLQGVASTAVHSAAMSTAAKVGIAAAVTLTAATGTGAAVVIYQNHVKKQETAFKQEENTMSSQIPITPEEEKTLVWAVSPDSGVFDGVTKAYPLSGRQNDWIENVTGPIGYPSQWTDSNYSPDVFVAECEDGKTLFNYEGEELLNKHYGYIQIIPWGGFQGELRNDIIFVTDIEPWEGDVYTDEYGNFLDESDLEILAYPLSSNYMVTEGVVLDQMNGVGASTNPRMIVNGKIYDSFNFWAYGVPDDVQPTEHYAQSMTLGLPRDQLTQVCADDFETILGIACIRNDGSVCPTMKYLPHGVMVNGIVAAKNVIYTDTTYQDTQACDFYEGIAAEGDNLAVMNAYTGKQLSDFIYDAIGFTVEGYTPVQRNGKWGLIRSDDGTVVIDCILDSITSVYKGMVYVQYGDVKGILDLAKTLEAGVAINEETLME